MGDTAGFRTFVVLNPNSSNGATRKRWPEIQAAIRDALGGPFDHAATTRPMEATTLTRDALREGYEMIVAIGGDGTNNEVVNGFFDEDGEPIRPGEPVMGLLPSATGGDFRKTVGLGSELAANAAALAGRHTRTIDVGRTTFVDHDGNETRRFFINITSFGIGGVVDAYVNRSTKRLGGKASFFIGATKAMLAYRNRLVRIRLDDGPAEERRINNIAVANGRFFGGGMQVAPAAELDDGLFDVVTFGDLTKFQYLRLAGSIYKGEHIGRDKISHARAKKVVAESDETVLIDMDGEQPGKLPITLEVVPGAIRLKIA